MAVHHRSEIEVKHKVGVTPADFAMYKDILSKLKFRESGHYIETDYLPDTDDGLCKKNGLLLRFRHVRTKTTSEWVLTLKTRSSSTDVIEFFETELSFKDGENETFRHINDVLSRVVGRTLSPRLLQMDTLDSVREALVEDGFTAHRILLDKYRQKYAKGQDHVLLDYFPDQMGAYIELESHDRESLDRLSTLLAIQTKKLTDDYGDILKSHKSGLSYLQQRTALFSPNEIKELLGYGDE